MNKAISHIVMMIAFLVASTVGAMAEEVSFRTPSDNIFCSLRDGAASCEIRDWSGPDPIERPDDCDLDWGYAFFVGATGKASMICAGDTIRIPNAKVLAHGKSVKSGGTVCTSKSAGVTCKNSAGRGFSLSKKSRRVF